MIRYTADPAHPDARRGLLQRLFARMYANYDALAERYEQAVSDHKRRLFADLQGTIVEIGAGTGANFPYYPPGIDWIGIEPNVFMHDALLKAAEKYAIRGEMRVGVAERIDLPNSSVDAVVSTLVLCSVDHQHAALREILRVLKPGGGFLFVEHVAAPAGTGLRRAQTLIKPLWKIAADGCRPDRDTVSAIRAAGFSSVEVSAFRAPLAIVSPHIAGKAIK
ncbi:MAG: methyltransferase domain-containing protein [bacterium]|nr:methyltransferase domain-containing protein [bacterium]